jgi:hypothetical protein
MSDRDSDAGSISDASHVDFDTSSNEALSTVAIRELCNQLRANEVSLLNRQSVSPPSNYKSYYSQAECIAVFQALKENTSVSHIDLSFLFQSNNVR